MKRSLRANSGSRLESITTLTRHTLLHCSVYPIRPFNHGGGLKLTLLCSLFCLPDCCHSAHSKLGCHCCCSYRISKAPPPPQHPPVSWVYHLLRGTFVLLLRTPCCTELAAFFVSNNHIQENTGVHFLFSTSPIGLYMYILKPGVCIYTLCPLLLVIWS